MEAEMVCANCAEPLIAEDPWYPYCSRRCQLEADEYFDLMMDVHLDEESHEQER